MKRSERFSSPGETLSRAAAPHPDEPADRVHPVRRRPQRRLWRQSGVLPEEVAVEGWTSLIQLDGLVGLLEET